MSKEKREFQATSYSPDSFQLEKVQSQKTNHSVPEKPELVKKPFFSPELIIRVTERIKKL